MFTFFRYLQVFVVSHSHDMNAICRSSTFYPVARTLVPDDKLPWNVQWDQYSPPNYTLRHLLRQENPPRSVPPYADPDIYDGTFKPNFNQVDGDLDRRSFQKYECAVKTNSTSSTDDVKIPLNPIGRTGLAGRGNLGRWGPNHAADAILTSWMKGSLEDHCVSDSGAKNAESTLRMVVIKRKDCGKWAIPGGFLNAGEDPVVAAKRELFEEAVTFDGLSKDRLEFMQNFLNKEPEIIYKGYVDDPRNTDNAWIETTVVHFHDDSGKLLESAKLSARDDAADVAWIDPSAKSEIYPPHLAILKILMNRLLGK
ncbi:ADP-ribose pyrophosphatase, mitochondrial-like [Uloborus diversus]|uniref:ADP-ribose pyrophosphatase, mitochondrial-like n=1 Tax=Uloborus diversus TaxID=327109 RepID=UPI002409480B|nr:ADP-ribose pyrophosphatase, mitochondrial-like [Uloborus diversus]